MSTRNKARQTASAILILAASAALAQSDLGARAFGLEREGRVAEAEAAWEALARQEPRNPQPLAHLGFLEARQEHYPEAIAYYKRAMVLSPTMPGLRLNLGLAYFKSGDYARTIETLSPLLKAQPDDERLAVLIGMSHYGLGQYAAASPYLMRASEHDPQNLNLLLTLAHSCLFANRYPCVVDAYHKIIALNAESAEADMLVGEALDEMKDKEGAIREFRAAAAANPKEPNVHFGLGYLLWTKSDYSGAAKEFQAELDNDPQHSQAMLYLADSDIQLSKLDEAQGLLEKLEKSGQESAKGHLDLGIVYSGQGHNQEALAEFQKAARLAPKDVNAHWRMGRLYRAMGRTAEAKAEFEKAKTLNEVADEHLLKIMSTLPASKSAASAGKPALPNQ